jgi:D-sedoheptulose 7-phosphate isomerase
MKVLALMDEDQKKEQNASRYFQTVFNLLTATRVTGKRGEQFSLDDGGDQAAQLIIGLLAAQNKAMVIGNGGSAALASHTQNDLCNSVGVPALVFTEIARLTALTNDHGYAVAFERQVAQWAVPGDLMIAISSSGRSENILHAAQTALERGCRLITLSGFHADNPLRHMGDWNFFVPVKDYGYVESAHAVLLHFLTDRAFFLKECQ